MKGVKGFQKGHKDFVSKVGRERQTKKMKGKHWVGKKHTEEWKRENGKRMKGNKHAFGHKPWNTGKHIQLNTGRTWFGKLEKHPCWRGGTSFEPYSTDWTETLKRSIRERDNYICQICSQYGNVVHHIDRNKKNCCPNNLVTVCVKCHNTKLNRK